ncbi:MAG TPA: SPFH domain-containing protein [Polyangiaceae bacterium]|jgi:regulator of protease activity HflC (stomatin/prohibitin superfamily)|nr:SPFH domain-containing protein [Polyangiaceae bacterium]
MRTSTAISCLALVAAALGTTGCSTTLVEPGHRGLYFAPNSGGLRRDVLQPGKYQLGWCFLYCTPNRVDDFDVTYSTKQEDVATKSAEGLDLQLKLSVIYRPIVSELYALDTEIGMNYYDEVVGPEFRSACRGVFARHSYTELQKKNESIENEVEAEVRRRTLGKHVEISSVTLENVTYAPEIAEKIRQREVGVQEAARQQASIASEHEKKMQIMNTENEAHEREIAIQKAEKQAEIDAAGAAKKAEIESTAMTRKIELEKESEQQKLEVSTQASAAKFKAEQQLATMEMEKKAARAELVVGQLKAEAAATAKIIEARADAEAARQMAGAHAAERRAETAGITPMEVQIHAYDALAHLGGTGTSILLGDWAHVPNFLFPRVPSMNGAFMMPYAAAPAPQAFQLKPSGNILSSTKPNDEPY